jgi:vitamin B12 transporter
MRRSILLTTAAIAVGLSTPAVSQTATEVEAVIVTATRLPAIVSHTPGARVIDEAAIEQRGAIFAADILNDIPGVSVTRTGAFAGVANVRIRGATPGKTLVLIDGIAVNDASDPDGAYDFSAFDLGDIQRVEVLSGPQSSLWGSDAIGGVIAFTTREVDGLRAEVEAGSFHTVRGRVAVGVANDHYALGAWVSRFETDGISAADEADGNPERDGVVSTTAGARGRYALTPALEVDGVIRWSRSEGELDGTPPPLFVPADTDDTTESEQWSGRLRATLEAGGLRHQFTLSNARLDRANQGSFASVFNSERQSYRYQADGETAVGRMAFTVGAERDEAKGSLSTGALASSGTTALFGVSRFDVTETFSLTGGLRWDDTDDFGSEVTGRLSAAYELPRGLIVSAAYGTGFKAPSISQALCDYCWSATPFPDLRPETATGGELALGWRSADGRITGRATAYRLDVENQISFFFDPVSFDSYYVNLARTRTDGLELEAHAVLNGGFNLSLAYGWTDARDENSGARLLRVPEHAGSATLGWTGTRWSGAVTVRAEGDQADFGGVRDGFVTANLNAAYALTPSVDLTARIENLADRHYQQVFGYGEPGRSAYVGIRLRY